MPRLEDISNTETSPSYNNTNLLKRKPNQLDRLAGFTWYYLHHDKQTYIIAELPSIKPSLAHSISSLINRFAKKNNLNLHASSQKKNNLLYLSAKDFKAYFDARNITQPTIKEATQELKYLFDDKLISSVSTTDTNYLAQLPSFTWYQLTQGTQTCIVTQLPSNNPSLANHTANAINHYAKANALQLHASCQVKNNLLYLTESCFMSYFSSINQNPPAVNDPSAELIDKFALSAKRKLGREHTANTLNQMTGPINSSAIQQPEGLLSEESEWQLKADNDATQSILFDKFSNIISGMTDDSTMTMAQSSESLTENCIFAFNDLDQFGLKALHYAWELDQQAQDSNNAADNNDNNPDNIKQNTKDKLPQLKIF